MLKIGIYERIVYGVVGFKSWVGHKQPNQREPVMKYTAGSM